MGKAYMAFILIWEAAPISLFHHYRSWYHWCWHRIDWVYAYNRCTRKSQHMATCFQCLSESIPTQLGLSLTPKIIFKETWFVASWLGITSESCRGRGSFEPLGSEFSSQGHFHSLKRMVKTLKKCQPAIAEKWAWNSGNGGPTRRDRLFLTSLNYCQKG